MKNLLGLLLLAVMTFHAFAQNSSRTLITIGNEEVSVDDFLSIYNKNRQVGEQLDPKTLDEYVDLFVNFKLKVKEAESLGMDTIPAFIKELSGYRKQLAKPYLVDTEVGEQLIQEVYNRLQTEVRASHILISVSENASPLDTLKAYNKILNLRNEILNGADFASAASLYSQDPSARDNSGDLGYFSALYMVYPFENAAFNTALGEVSEIIRTRFGYHILKVTDKRSSRGEVKTAHIMVKFDKKSGHNATVDKQIAKQKIDDIYLKLIEENADFTEMAKQYSDDKKSALNGGQLPWFGSNKMVTSFEDAAFKLELEGALSKPVQTPYGWHIIKLLDRRALGAFEEEKDEIKKRVEKDSRAQLKRTYLVNRLKKEYDFKVSESVFTALKRNAEVNVITGKLSFKQPFKSPQQMIFSIANTQFYLDDFLVYLFAMPSIQGKSKDAELYIDDAFSKWSEDQIIAYEDAHLETKYNDFRLLMKEYRDGILLYELTDEKIWTKAIKDTTGLKAFYEANKDRYMWDVRVKAKIINCLNDKVAHKVQKRLRKSSVDFEKLKVKINKKSSLNMVVEEGLFSRGDNAFVDQVVWSEGVSDLIYDNQNVKIICVDEVLPPQAKALSQIKGLIISDYQESLQAKWISELKSKYLVKVNEDVLELLKNNRLNELIPVAKIEEIPVYTGNFAVAFRKALKDLGSSQKNLFEWSGKHYTTELK
ncbi:MAG: peptidylprolyl isomerase [Flavobacteriales bacterium]|nr:peptidylprolyl isomerase [Flavobacteriales bacterium]